jgi:hypothetical protein
MHTHYPLANLIWYYLHSGTYLRGTLILRSLHPDPQGSDDGSDDDDDDAYIDADTTAFEVFTGEEGEELSEVGTGTNSRPTVVHCGDPRSKGKHKAEPNGLD